MSISTITAAQRVELRDSLMSAELLMQKYTQSATIPSAAEVALATPVLAAAAEALEVAGASGLPGTSAVISNLQSLTVTDASAAPSVAVIAHVTAGVVGAFTLNAATDCILQNGFAIPMQNSAGTSIPGTHPATVAAGTVNNCKLASTVGVVVNAVKQSGWTITGTGTFFTPTVVAGVCTGGVLSAS